MCRWVSSVKWNQNIFAFLSVHLHEMCGLRWINKTIFKQGTKCPKEWFRLQFLFYLFNSRRLCCLLGSILWLWLIQVKLYYNRRIVSSRLFKKNLPNRRLFKHKTSFKTSQTYPKAIFVYVKPKRKTSRSSTFVVLTNPSVYRARSRDISLTPAYLSLSENFAAVDFF